MITTLPITILVEGIVVIGYSLWRKKPAYKILVTSIWANLITQSMLWVVLKLFFRYYVMTLIAAELLIWIIESILLCSISANRLRFSDAILLSLCMNLSSFAVGWFLPV
ncbi:MAG: hypothetical protein ACXW4E_06635 [Anaerolineales bacterium]